MKLLPPFLNNSKSKINVLHPVLFNSSIRAKWKYKHRNHHFLTRQETWSRRWCRLLKRLPCIRKVVCSNPGRDIDRPTSFKNVGTFPQLQNDRYQVTGLQRDVMKKNCDLLKISMQNINHSYFLLITKITTWYERYVYQLVGWIGMNAENCLNGARYIPFLGK